VLRDWARLGLMVANRGQWAGRQVVPAKWLSESTTVQPEWPAPTYGYHFWISHVNRTRFFMSGVLGQYVFINPALRMVVVQTALDKNDLQDEETIKLVLATYDLYK